MTANTRTEAVLVKFFRRAVSKLAGNTKICLQQVTTGGGASLLREMVIDQDSLYDDERINIGVAEFLTDAQDDADGHRGMTAYCLVAYKGLNRSERSPLFRLRNSDSEFESEALGETEPATKDGHLAQLMRHNEALMRQNAIMMETMSNQSTNIIARLTETNKHYEDRHWETAMRAEELADEKEAREQSRMQLISSDKRKDQIMALLKPMVPIAMAKFKGTPAAAKPELFKESLKHILADLSPDKMEKIADILGPQSLALMELYMEAHKEDEANEQANGVGNT